MRANTWWSVGIGAVAAAVVVGVVGPAAGGAVGMAAMLGAAVGFDRLSERRIDRGTCESCGEPAAVELDDRSLWCMGCQAGAWRLGYDQGNTDG